MGKSESKKTYLKDFSISHQLFNRVLGVESSATKNLRQRKLNMLLHYWMTASWAITEKTKTTTLMLMWEVYETGFFGSVRYHVIIRFKCTLMAFSVIRCCDVILALKCALQPRCIHPKLYDWTFLIRKTSMDMSKKFVLLAVKIDINIFLSEMFQIVFVVTEMGNLKRF